MSRLWTRKARKLRTEPEAPSSDWPEGQIDDAVAALGNCAADLGRTRVLLVVRVREGGQLEFWRFQGVGTSNAEPIGAMKMAQAYLERDLIGISEED